MSMGCLGEADIPVDVEIFRAKPGKHQIPNSLWQVAAQSSRPPSPRLNDFTGPLPKSAPSLAGTLFGELDQSREFFSSLADEMGDSKILEKVDGVEGGEPGVGLSGVTEKERQHYFLACYREGQLQIIDEMHTALGLIQRGAYEMNVEEEEPPDVNALVSVLGIDKPDTPDTITIAFLGDDQPIEIEFVHQEDATELLE